jgi:hypothetical protein
MEEEKELKKGQKAYLKSIVNKFQDEANEALRSIDKLKTDLITGKDGETSLIQKFKTTESELDHFKESIKGIYNSIFEEDENGEILNNSIEEFKYEFKKKKNEIIEIQNEIIEIQNKLLGFQDDDGTEIKGVKQIVEEFVNNLEALHKSNKQRQEQLFEKIEGLLKGASTVALAEAFHKHKESFNLSNIIWIITFILSIASMMTLSIIAFVSSKYNLSEMWKYTLGNLPFLGGAIWLAIFSSRQRSQNIRLQQEYAFKEDIAKIYYGLKQEIEELGDSDLGQKLNEKILNIIVETISYNPSETLESKNHGDKGPILEALNSIVQMVNKKNEE